MRRRMKMDGYVDEPGPVLNGELRTDYVALRGSHFPARTYVVALRFGDEDVALWDVTERRADFEEQPGDYRTTDEQDRHEEHFVEVFLAEKLRAVFGGLEGVIQP